MSVKVERRHVTEFNGQTVEETFITAKCDGPTCQKEGTACKGTLTWKEATNEKEMKEIPDDVFRILIVSNFLGGKVILFSRECLKEFMRNYAPPKTPREIEEQVKAQAEVIKKHQEEVAVKRQAALESAATPPATEEFRNLGKTIGGVSEEGPLPSVGAGNETA